ncbi:MAG: iron-sulfur cluster assembly protein [Candidatus Latescibacterota bacterium]|jgi:iron-sulfur cluster assembly protein
MVSVTEMAARKIKDLIVREGHPEGHGLRLKVIGGGCSGLSYQLEFDGTVGEDDSTIDAYGVQVFVDMKSALYLTGTELDYDDGLMGTGFRFNNPNAKNQCGCGESFSV